MRTVMIYFDKLIQIPTFATIAARPGLDRYFGHKLAYGNRETAFVASATP